MSERAGISIIKAYLTSADFSVLAARDYYDLPWLEHFSSSNFEYISKDSKRYARLEILKIQRRTHILKVQPFIGKEVTERGNFAVRELVEVNYRIIYKLVYKV